MYGMMDPLSWMLLRQHHEEILREAEKNRLAGKLREGRKRRYVRALAWELERAAGWLRKLLRSSKRVPTVDEKETI